MTAVPVDPPPSGGDPRHYRRGIYLLPSIITVGNLFCGYACIVFAMRGELVTAAPDDLRHDSSVILPEVLEAWFSRASA